MSRLKRFLVILFTILMIISFTACGDSDQTVQQTSARQIASNSSETTDPDAEKSYDPLGKYEEPITITTVGILYPPENNVPQHITPENQSFNTIAEEKLNIKLEYLWTVVSDQFINKFNVSLASGELSDVMYVNDQNQFESLVASQSLGDLTEAYNYLIPELKDLYSGNAKPAKDYATRDGKLYSFVDTGYNMLAAQSIYIRNDWMKSLNLQVPTTYQELVEVANAFANNDPDKNGKKDTWGIGIHKELLWSGALSTQLYFEMFHAYPNAHIKGDDGKIHSGLMQPEVKNALKGLQELYKRGIIDKEFATKDYDQLTEDILAGKIGIVFGEWWTPNWPLNHTIDKVPEAEWVTIPMVSSDDKPALPGIDRVRFYGFNCVSKDCKNPEAAAKLINLFYDIWYKPDPEQRYGDAIKEENGFFYNDVPLKVWDEQNLLKARTKVLKALETRDVSDLRTHDEKEFYENSIKYLDQHDMSGWGVYYSRVAPDGGLATVERVAKSGEVVYNEFFGQYTPTMVEKGDSFGLKASETFIRIIMGDSLDKFDKLSEEIDRLGGVEIEKELNDWYQKMGVK